MKQVRLGALLAVWLCGGLLRGESKKPAPELFGGHSVVLARGGTTAATIVYGKATKEHAAELRAQVRELTKLDLPTVSDHEVVEQTRFDYRAPWQSRALILVGNVSNNRALLALYARFLVGVNESYPGPGRYIVRTLLEPIRSGADVLVVGGSDDAGLRAGVKRAAALIASSTDGQATCAVRPMVEVGNADGPIGDNSRYRGRGLDAFYWEANVKAGSGAKQAFLRHLTPDSKDLKRWSGSHYTWEGRYRGLLKMLAAGLFDEKQIADVQNRLYENLVKTDDSWGKRALIVPPREWNRRMTRHTLTGFTGQLLLADYLHHVGRLEPAQKQVVAKHHANLRGILEEIARSRRYRSGIEGREGIDVLGNLANVLFYLGDESALRSDLYREMAAHRLATRDNLGCHAGVDSYIGSRPGHQFNPASASGPATHLGAWLLSDPELLGITDLDEQKRPVTYMGVRFPPDFARPGPGTKPASPQTFTGLQVLPMDGFFQGFAGSSASGSESFARYDAGKGRAFDRAVFRDGFGRQDAYLLLQGINVSAPMYREGIFGNAIIRYTELGSLFLFSNTQIVGSWSRSVTRVSRGRHDPQSTACLDTGSFKGSQVSAIQSLQEQNGGASWTRTILRRHGGYFVVVDKVTAHHADDYNLSCQWRSYHHGELLDARRFAATDMMNGAQMHIVSARPYGTELVQQERDGAADPLMVRQFQDRTMEGGEAVTFGNLVYATGSQALRTLDVRESRPGEFIVRGTIGGQSGLALVSTEGIDDLARIDTDARIAYLSEGTLCAIAAKRVQCPGLRAECGTRFSLEAGAEGGTITIENPTDADLSLLLKTGRSETDLTVPPGKLTRDVQGHVFRKKRVARALEGHWKDAKSRAVTPRTRAARPSLPEAKVVWNRGLFQVPPRPFHGFKLEVESEPPVEANVLVDRDHHRWSHRLNFSGKGGWKMKIQLGSPRDAESIRLIGYRSNRLFPEGLTFDLLLEGEGDPRAVPNVAPISRFWHSECEKYLETARHPALVIPVNARVSAVTVTAQESKETKARYAFQEVRVFVNDAKWRAKISLHRILEGGRQALIAVGPGAIARLDPSGQAAWRWKADSPILHHFVEFSKTEKRWLIGVWPASQRFTLLDSQGKAVLEPSAFETKENSRLLGGYSRPHAATIWEREAGKPADIAFFPHYSFGQIRRGADGARAEIGEGRGGKAVLRTPDITGDNCEELFVVGRYENNNGLLPSQREGVEEPTTLAGQHWTGNRVSNWTGWSAGNMELTMYHGASLVHRETDGKAEWLGVVAVNPGGLNFYRQPAFEQVWDHFNHPGNLCHTVGDIDRDGVDEILVGREDGFLSVYRALTGEQIRSCSLGGDVRAVLATGQRLVVGTSRSLLFLDEQYRPIASAPGPVESVQQTEGPDGRRLVVAALSDGSLKAFPLP